MCMCVHVSVCIYVYAFVYVHKFMHIHIYICIYHVCIFVYVCVLACMWGRGHMYVGGQCWPFICQFVGVCLAPEG